MNPGKYILGILIATDEEMNAVLGGNAHYTLSQRVGFMRRNGSKFGCICCQMLNIMFWTKDHCGDAIADFPDNLPTEG